MDGDAQEQKEKRKDEDQLLGETAGLILAQRPRAAAPGIGKADGAGSQDNCGEKAKGDDAKVGPVRPAKSENLARSQTNSFLSISCCAYIAISTNLGSNCAQRAPRQMATPKGIL